MVTLWPIPSEAREALENGHHVQLTLDPGGRKVVVGFEEHVSEGSTICDWEIENGWNENPPATNSIETTMGDITINNRRTEAADDHKVTTEEELVFSERTAKYILQRLFAGDYQQHSEKGVQKKMREKADRVVIERHHYDPHTGEYVDGSKVKGGLNSETGP